MFVVLHVYVFFAVNTVFSSSENRTFQFATAVGEGSQLSRSHFGIWTDRRSLKFGVLAKWGTDV